MKSNSEKHILILTPGFPENEADTTCIPALQLYVKALSASNALKKISIISFQYPSKKEAYDWNGVCVFPINGRNKRGLWKLLIWLKVFVKFIRIKRSCRVDIIHSFWYTECALTGSIISAFFQIPHVSTFMGQDSLKNNRYPKLIFRSPIVVSLTQFQERGIHKNHGIVSDYIIPWGVDETQFITEPNKDRPIDVLGVGSLIALKNYTLFVDIIVELQKRGINLKCVIIGKGPEYESLERRIIEHGLSDVIELKGVMDRDEILSYMKKSKVLLHPSDYESFGMVFIEALMSGMKVVSKPVGCFEESENWQTGGNQEQLQEALLGLLGNTAGHRNQSFDILDTVRNYLKVYEQEA